MLATGWTADEMRRAPARVVRALMWRIFAAGVWSDDLAQLSRQPVAHRSAFGSATAWADAQRARTQAKSVVDEIERTLWPEGD